VRPVAEVIVVLRVLTSLFFLPPRGGTLVSRAQICRTAGFRTDSADRHQPFHLLRPARWTRNLGTAGPLKVLERLFTLKALILKNGHKSPRRNTAPSANLSNSQVGKQSFILLE